MPCECRNEDGTLSQTCKGCLRQGIYNPDSQIRAQEDGFTTKQLNQITDIVRQVLRGSPILDSAWQDGFIKGFERGVKHGQENCGCC